MNSRPQKQRNQTWRRRICTACGAVFTTTEAIDLTQVLSVVTDSRKRAKLTPFSRDQLFISLYKSLQHRPTALQDARGLCDTIIAHIISATQNGTISLRTITRITLNTLQHFDTAAATHYAAFHASNTKTTKIALEE